MKVNYIRGGGRLRYWWTNIRGNKYSSELSFLYKSSQKGTYSKIFHGGEGGGLTHLELLFRTQKFTIDFF